MFVDPSKLPATAGGPPTAADPALDGFEADGIADERRVVDRRRYETPRFSRWTWLGGRRRGIRRDEEREGSFVDVHGMRLWMVVMWIALMNVGDSYFTLVHLQAGGVEMNPIAQLLLDFGRFAFVFLKSGLIGCALVVLAIHKNFKLARIGVYVSAATYTLLVTYHLALFKLN